MIQEQNNDLIYQVIQQIFGDQEKVQICQFLYQQPCTSLFHLIQQLAINDDSLKKHLIQLIQYQFIVSKYEEKRYLFLTDINHFYNFQLIPVILQEIKKKMGRDTVLIIELILQNGFLEVESKQNLAFLQDKIRKSKQYARKKIEELKEQNFITQFTYPFELEIEAQQAQNTEKKRIFHKVNLQQFVKKFKRDLVINIAQKQLSQQTIDILQQILLCDRDISMKTLEDNNKILSTEAIVQSIDTLCNENYIKRKESSKFQANNEHLQNLLVNQIVLKQISFKFSPIHSRVLMVLRNKGQLDDKAISELALISLKDCRIILNELFEQGYISTHEIAIKPRENVGQFTYFYSEDWRQSVLNTKEDLLRGINRQLAIRGEVEQEAERLCTAGIIKLCQLLSVINEMKFDV